LDNCRKHLRINPADLTAYVRRGLSLLLLGKDDEAAQDFEAVLSHCPDCKDDLQKTIQTARDRGRMLHSSQNLLAQAHAC
jgi:hypothetical protein